MTLTSLEQKAYPEEFVKEMGIEPDSWVSSKPAVASIDKDGKIVFHKKGSVKISAVYNGVGKKSVKYSVTVKMNPNQKKKNDKKDKKKGKK